MVSAASAAAQAAASAAAGAAAPARNKNSRPRPHPVVQIAKRARGAPHGPVVKLAPYVDLAIRFLQESAQTANTAFLDAYSFRLIFPKESDQYLVRVADCIWHAVINPDQEQGTLGLNSVMYAELRNEWSEYDNDTWIQVSAVAEPTGQVTSELQLKVSIPSSKTTNGDRRLDYDDVRENIYSALEKEWLCAGQRLLVPYMNGLLEVYVASTNVDSTRVSSRVTIDQETQLRLTAGRAVEFVREITIDDIDIIEIVASLRDKRSNYQWWKDGALTPLVVEEQQLEQLVRQAFDGKQLCEGLIERQFLSHQLEYHFSIGEIVEIDDSDDSEGLKLLCELGPDTPITIRGSRSLIILRESDQPKPAKRIALTIIGDKLKPATGRSKNNIVPVDLFTQQVRQRFADKPLVRNTQFTIQVPNGKFLVFVTSGEGLDDAEIDDNDARTPWMLTDGTQLDIRIDEAVKCTLVDNSDPIPMDEIEFYVTTPTGAGAAGALFAMLAGGGDDKKKSHLLKQSELETLFREVRPARIQREEELSTYTRDGLLLNFKVRSWSPQGGALPDTSYGLLGEITKETKVTFTLDKEAAVTVIKPGKPVNPLHISEEVKKLGLGGLGKQFEELIRKVLTSRGAFKLVDKAAGVKVDSGVLLYGPPGTGKTLTLRKTGFILGVDQDRIKVVSGGELLDKYVGETERKITELFAPAKEAYELHGDKAPLFIIGIDELETVMGDRKNAERSWEKSRVGTLLAQMDGYKQLPNVLVFGLTNYKDQIDPALLRNGRFGIQIEIKIPDNTGRFEILDIYLNPKRELNMVADEVDSKVLAELTNNYSGASLEAVVNVALTFPKKRIFDARARELEANRGDMTDEQLAVAMHAPFTVQEFAEHPLAKITMEDLRAAIKEVNPKEEPVSTGMMYI